MEAGVGTFPPMQIRVAFSLRKPCVISQPQGHAWPASLTSVVALLSRQWAAPGRWRPAPCGRCAPAAASGRFQVKGARGRHRALGRLVREFFATGLDRRGHGGRVYRRHRAATERNLWLETRGALAAGCGAPETRAVFRSDALGRPHRVGALGNCTPVPWRHRRWGRRSGLKTVGDLESSVSQGCVIVAIAQGLAKQSVVIRPAASPSRHSCPLAC